MMTLHANINKETPSIIHVANKTRASLLIWFFIINWLLLHWLILFDHY
jgi:hypothetical protein